MKKKIVILSLISLLLLPIANFNIKAETSTYAQITNEYIKYIEYDRKFSNETTPTHFEIYLKANKNVRCALFRNNSIGCAVENYTTDNSGILYKETSSNGTSTIQQINLNSSYNTTYGTVYISAFSLTVNTYHYNYQFYNGLNYIDADYNAENTIKYTYGDSAVAPTPTITWGEIDNLKYYSNLLTSNPAGNIDTIYWNGYQDTNGNDITGLKIEIKAESGYFTAQDKPSLLQETFANWIRDTKPSVQIYKGTTLQEKVAVEWQTVADQFKQNTETLGQFFWSIFAKEGWYYQYGWRYYARLLDENEEPISEWQELIQATSYTPQATETLTDDEPLTPDDVDTINDINNENDTDNNWYINNTVINNNTYNNTYQQNIIENIYNILQGTPDGNNQQLATDTQNTVDNAIDTEDDYTNQLQNQLNDLELNDISQNNGLIKALRWVREVHKETIEQTVFGEIVLTVMLIGLITYLIGRRNG